MMNPLKRRKYAQKIEESIMGEIKEFYMSFFSTCECVKENRNRKSYVEVIALEHYFKYEFIHDVYRIKQVYTKEDLIFLSDCTSFVTQYIKMEKNDPLNSKENIRQFLDRAIPLVSTNLLYC